jgi:hypothetical protein
VKQRFIGGAVLALVGFVLTGCGSPAPGTLEGTAAACLGIYPVNNFTPQNVGTVRLEVVVYGGSSTVASQQLKGTLANSFHPSYKVALPPGTYRAVAFPEVREPWPLQSRMVRVESNTTTHSDFGCSGAL